MRIARDAVIGDLGVGDVGAEGSGHVAGSAVELILVMPGGELFAVAGNAFGAEVRDTIFGRNGLVGVVAGGASKPGAGFFLAGAFGEGFELAGGAETGRDIAGEDVVADIGGEIVAGMEIVDVFAGALDGRVAFEMALHADLIAKNGREFRGIDDGRGGILRVGGAGAVAAFAGDAGKEKGRVGVEVVAAVERSANAADVAVHATGGGGEIERHGGRRAKGRGHVPKVAIGVIVDRRFEKEAVGGEEVGAAAAAFADVVEEFAGVVDVRVAGAIEGEEDFAVVVSDFVMDAGGLVGKLPGDEILRGGTAGIGHRSVEVGFVDLGVAFGTGGVADVAGWIAGSDRSMRIELLGAEHWSESEDGQEENTGTPKKQRIGHPVKREKPAEI